MQLVPRAVTSLDEPERCRVRCLPTQPVVPHSNPVLLRYSSHHRMNSHDSFRDHKRSLSSPLAMDDSPTTGSKRKSPHSMVPPPNPFGTMAPVPRSTTLSAPSIPQLGARSPGYSSHSYSHSASPSTASGSLPESQSHDSPSLNLSPTQFSSATLNAQKRAYRQRRKDPSCDACRERKVKCDATETTACSECSSRNHKCQFTKETNRRMSSIKQVQDLQSQIAELTQMNSQLRTKVSDKESRDLGVKRRYSETLTETMPPHRRVSMPIFNSFGQVRSNIRKHSRGVFNTPHHVRSAPTKQASDTPEIPPRADFAQLSRHYLDSVHVWYPAIHWPTFQHEVDEVYTLRTFDGVSREWMGLFFAVLACGTLQIASGSSDSSHLARSGKSFFDIATRVLSPWSQELTVTHAQAALLCSIFATESNNKSVGSIWLASAVRVAQELQISPEIEGWSVVDAEIRRRLWWSIYIRDRITSLETNRRLMIHEDDCEISLPSSVEDRYIQPQGLFRSRTDAPPFTGWVATIHITRLYAELVYALKSNVVSLQNLQSLDDQIQSKLLLLPEAYQPNSTSPLETAALPTMFTLLSARFHLYRRNFSPAAHVADRAEALSRCTLIAQDTAKYISRVIHNPPKPEAERSWQARVSTIASNQVCMHTWRCMLVLCFRGEYDAALMCLHLFTAIGTTRKINGACGRNMVFFLEQLLDRIRSGHASFQRLEYDEEMMAYVSGDAQGNLEQSWVWAGTDLGSSSSPHLSPRSTTQVRGPDDSRRESIQAAPLSDYDALPWDDWGRVDYLIRQLAEENRPRPAPPAPQVHTPMYYPSSHNPVKRIQLGPETRSPPKSAPLPATAATTSSSRISIANII